jgi:hypothetical protein
VLQRIDRRVIADNDGDLAVATQLNQTGHRGFVPDVTIPLCETSFCN